MSTEIEKDILCPQCGQSQKYRLYASINAKENPELKRRVLSETLFDWRCKRCNYFAAMAYSFLYTDPEAGYIVCVAPGGEGRTAQPTQEIQSYTKRVVKNLAEHLSSRLTTILIQNRPCCKGGPGFFTIWKYSPVLISALRW